MMVDELASVLLPALNFMVPILLASLGEIVTERSGVVNIGLEGIINLSAFTAAAVAFTTGNPWLGLAASACVGLALGLSHGALSAYLRADQIIVGIGVNMLAYGISVVGLIMLWEQHGASPPVAKLPSITLAPGYAISPLAVASILAGLAIWLLLSRTTVGLRLRACGEDPKAAEAMGIRVNLVRTLASGFGGLLAGIGGGFLALGIVGQFVRNIAAGRGFIALANVAFSGWNPLIAILGAYLFGSLESLALYLQTIVGRVELTYPLRTIPYIGTLIVVALFRFRARMPRSLGKPYIKE
jgi:simple sugar transport system permease protein